MENKNKKKNDKVKIVKLEKKTYCYETSGYCLSYYNKKYAIKNISHCSCNGTEIADTSDHTLTYEEIRKLAKEKSEPRIPDIKTTNKWLIKIYTYIESKQNEEELLQDAYESKF